jgi:hypothetical protein
VFSLKDGHLERDCRLGSEIPRGIKSSVPSSVTLAFSVSSLSYINDWLSIVLLVTLGSFKARGRRAIGNVSQDTRNCLSRT